MSAAPVINNGVSDIFTIVAADGAKATVHSQGGHVTSWVGSAGDERLYLSPAHKFGKGKAIRGGVPIIFPQFSDMGKGPSHGVARSRQWSRLDDGRTAGKGVFAFSIAKGDSVYPGAASFLELTVTVSDEQLDLTARVFATKDTTDAEFGFLFHTYFAVSDINKVKIEGFEGKYFANGLKKRESERTSDSFNTIERVTDSIFYKNTEPLRIVDNALGRTMVVTGSSTCPDVVLWNPGQETIGKLGDMPQPDGYKHFVCIEHGAVGPKARFPSGTKAQPWVGSQTIRVIKHDKKGVLGSKL